MIFLLVFGMVVYAATWTAIKVFKLLRSVDGRGPSSALHILQERLARGEIDVEEYEQRRQALEQRQGGVRWMGAKRKAPR